MSANGEIKFEEHGDGYLFFVEDHMTGSGTSFAAKSIQDGIDEAAWWFGMRDESEPTA